LVCASERVLGTAGEGGLNRDPRPRGLGSRTAAAPVARATLPRTLNGTGGTRDYRPSRLLETEFAVIPAVWAAANVALVTASQWPESELQPGVVDHAQRLLVLV
jgi:hypothetical protein